RREHGHGSIDGAHRLSSLAQEVRIPRRVDDRDFVLLPMEMVKRRGDAHLVSDFLGLEIEEGGAVVHAPEPAYFARREQQRIGERGLAHTALAENGDVADLRYVFN